MRPHTTGPQQKMAKRLSFESLSNSAKKEFSPSTVPPGANTAKTDWVWVDDNNKVKDALKLLDQDRLAVDSETYGITPFDTLAHAALCPHMGRISILQMRGDQGPTVVFDIMVLEQKGFDWAAFSDFLASRKALVFANAQFDLKFLKRHTTRLFWNASCVISLARLLTNATGSKLGKARGHSLADLVRDYLDIHLEGKGQNEQKSVWSVRPLPKKKLAYAVGDVEFLLPLQDLLLPVLTNPLPTSRTSDQPFGWGMKELVALEMQMTTVAAEIEFNGLPASREIFQQLSDLTETRLSEVTKQLCDKLSLDFELDPYSDEVHIPAHTRTTLNNPQKLVTLLQSSMGFSLDNAQAKVLERLLELMQGISFDEQGNRISDPDFVGEEAQTFQELELMEEIALTSGMQILPLVLEYKRLTKQKGMNLLRFINPVTGRVHPSFNTLGAATGRSSSSRPNLQNVTTRTTLLGKRQRDNLWPSSSVIHPLEEIT